MAKTGKYLRPPEAPIFHPTVEEFNNPIAYISSILPKIEKYGICKITSPKSFQPIFNLNVRKSFVPREQYVNELSITNRFRLLFNEKVHTFWQCRAVNMKNRIFEKCGFDAYLLYTAIKKVGGVVKLQKNPDRWTNVFKRLNCPEKYQKNVQNVHRKYLLPFLEFHAQMKVDLAGKRLKPNPERDLLLRKARRKELKLKRTKQTTMKQRTMKQATTKQATMKQAAPTVAKPPQTTRKGRKRKRAVNGRYVNRVNLPSTSKSMASHEQPKENTEKLEGKESLDVCIKCRKACRFPRTKSERRSQDSLNHLSSPQQRCKQCISQALKALHEKYGFEDADREFTIAEFAKYNELFMKKTFGPEQDVSLEEIEEKYWKTVDNFLEQVTVYYGADIRSDKFGSGFVRETDDLSGEKREAKEFYARHPWNVNNFATHKESVLRFLGQTVSGVTVPWMYIGMCFSSFCWHVEDHWAYSVNYQHQGATKVWYAVSGRNAEKFEEVASNLSPEITRIHPDIIHHMTTMINPGVLMESGVPVFTVHQNPGDFVITLPRAYHSGFNAGLNINEAVNFAPSDWLLYGALCTENYSKMRRQCVFAFDELVMRMAAAVAERKCRPAMQVDVIRQLAHFCKKEVALRAAIKKLGVVKREQTKFETFKDDGRCCRYCQTTLFHSSVQCEVHPQRQVCLDHVERLCKKCPPTNYMFRYRYTMNCLYKVLKQIQKLASPSLRWLKRVNECNAAISNKEHCSLGRAQQIIDEGILRKYPVNGGVLSLRRAIAETNKWLRKISDHLNAPILAKTGDTMKPAKFKLLVDKLFKCPLTPSDDFVECVKGTLRRMDSWLENYEKLREIPIDIDDSLDDVDYEKRANQLIADATAMCLDYDELADIRKVSNFLQELRNCESLKERIQRLGDSSRVQPLKEGEEEASTARKTDVVDKSEVSEAVTFLRKITSQSTRVSNLLQVLEPVERRIVFIESLCDKFTKSGSCSFEKALEIMAVNLLTKNRLSSTSIAAFLKEMYRTGALEEVALDIAKAKPELSLDMIDFLMCVFEEPIVPVEAKKVIRRYEPQLKLFTKYMADLFAYDRTYYTFFEVIGGREDLSELAEGKVPPMSLSNLIEFVYDDTSIYQYDHFIQLETHMKLMHGSHLNLIKRLREVNASRPFVEQTGNAIRVATCQCGYHRAQDVANGEKTITCYLCRAGFHSKCITWEPALERLPKGVFLCQRCLRGKRPSISAVEYALNISERQHAHTLEFKMFRWVVDHAKSVTEKLQAFLHNKTKLEKHEGQIFDDLVIEYLLLEFHSPSIINRLNQTGMLAKRCPQWLDNYQQLENLKKEKNGERDPVQMIFPLPFKPHKKVAQQAADEEILDEEEEEDAEFDWHDEEGNPRVRICGKGDECLKPFGETVQWVHCDGHCDQWLHYVCAGVTIHTNFTHWMCKDCKRKSRKRRRHF